MIEPTIGRVIWVFNRHNRFQSVTNPQPEPALICYIHSNELINVAGFDRNGDPFKETSIPLFQGLAGDGPEQVHACWMPYQQAQAGRYDRAR